MRNAPVRIGRSTRLAAMFTLLLAAPMLTQGCAGPDEPEYWAKKIKKSAWREQAIKSMTDMYNKELTEAKGNREDPKVKKTVDVMIPPLIETFQKYKTDNQSRGQIAGLLAQMQDPRAIPVFEELLNYQKGINETDASKAAESLGVLGSDESIPKIINMLDAIRADRGADGRNRPEDDWMSRSAVEAMRLILVKNPDTPNRQAAITALNEILETTADQQDFFINKVAAKALGDIADPQSIPILIRGLFFQGRGATVFQQCRVGLMRISVENRQALIDKLLEAYKGDFKDLEKDAERFSFFHGIKENKIGLLFYELQIDPQKDKAVFDLLMSRITDPEIDKEGVLQGMAAETLAMLAYAPLTDKIIEITDKKEWYNDSLSYKVFASFMSGLVGTQSIKLPMNFDPRLATLMLDVMEDMAGDSNAPFRVSAGLIVSTIGQGADVKKRYYELTEKEENEEVKTQLEDFKARFEATAECGKDQACWIGKLDVDEEQWRVKQLASMWLGEIATPDDAQVADALSKLLNQGKDKDGKPIGTQNQDVLKAVLISLGKVSNKGCVGKTCERLSVVIPYFRRKPQYAVIANSGECMLAVLYSRQGGKLSDLASITEGSGGISGD